MSLYNSRVINTNVNKDKEEPLAFQTSSAFPQRPETTIAASAVAVIIL